MPKYHVEYTISTPTSGTKELVETVESLSRREAMLYILARQSENCVVHVVSIKEYEEETKKKLRFDVLVRATVLIERQGIVASSVEEAKKIAETRFNAYMQECDEVTDFDVVKVTEYGFRKGGN